jgi:hypothetical protein
MSYVLSQWTLLRRLPGAVLLCLPDGTERHVPLDRLRADTADEVSGLAIGSKLPLLLADLLLAVARPQAPVLADSWTLHYYGGPDAFYVHLCAPGSKQPTRLSLSGLDPIHRRELRWLVRGDAVPAEILRALGVEPGIAADGSQMPSLPIG